MYAQKGLEVAKTLSFQGCRVIMACRNTTAADSACRLLVKERVRLKFHMFLIASLVIVIICLFACLLWQARCKCGDDGARLELAEERQEVRRRLQG